MQQRNIGRGEIEGQRFCGKAPAQLSVIVGQRRALKVRHPPGVQMDPAAGDLPLMASDIASWAGDDLLTTLKSIAKKAIQRKYKR